jgi:hypothetical protein
VLVSVSVIGFTLIGMHHSAWGRLIGSAPPQVTLMATIIQGACRGSALGIHLRRRRTRGDGPALRCQRLARARRSSHIDHIPDLRRRQHALAGGSDPRYAEDSEVSPGMLYDTGLVAGGSIAGL